MPGICILSELQWELLGRRRGGVLTAQNVMGSSGGSRDSLPYLRQVGLLVRQPAWEGEPGQRCFREIGVNWKGFIQPFLNSSWSWHSKMLLLLELPF